MAASPDAQPLNAEAVGRHLHTNVYGRTLHVLDEATSTNSIALSLAAKGAPHGTLVVADRQTAGRGRLGRPWFSPPRENLYGSLLLRTLPPGEQLERWLSWVPLISAVAVARGIERVAGVLPALKWPNDLLLEGRKVGGLLCESAAGLPPPCVIVGIGLNVNTPAEAFPPDLRQIATSLRATIGHDLDRSVLLAAVLFELEFRHETLLLRDPARAKQEYVALCATIGHRVRVALAGGETTVVGTAAGLAPDGSLEIRREPEGTVVTVNAGDVFHLR